MREENKLTGALIGDRRPRTMLMVDAHLWQNVGYRKTHDTKAWAGMGLENTFNAVV